MYKDYDGDGIETPITYDVIEDHEGEIRSLILEQYCFDTALEKEYEFETEHDGEATVYTKDWLEPFEIMQLDLISEFSHDEFWVDLTVEKLESILKSHREDEEIGDHIHQLRKDERVA